MPFKDIQKGHEARLKIKAGVDKACDAVRPTLGPIGMTALIEWPGLDPIECDDGVTILKNLEFKDRHENLGLQVMRKAALRTSREGGDGTATTTVLTQALVDAAFKEIATDSSKIREVKERLTAGLQSAISELSKIKRDVSEDDIERIATISSLDPEVAKLIAEIIKEIGIHGVVTVEKSSQLGLSKEVVKGARFDKGLISAYFVNDVANMQTVLENPYIFLIDRKVSTNEQIMGILKSVGTGADILFIADDVDSVALGTLAQNAANKVANIACVRNPYTASRGKDFLMDIAALTGATVISEERGMKLDEQTKAVSGTCEKVIVTRDTTTIIGGKASARLDERIAIIKGQLESTTSEYEKEMLEERLAALTGGIGVIRVGAYTDTEFNAKKYKFENAINATQAALQEGILPGGGTALAKVSELIEDPMFKTALVAPLRQMAVNSGMFQKTTILGKPSVEWVIREVIERELPSESDNLPHAANWAGFDFKNKSFCNMSQEGIIDPFKVTRLALESAVAITSSLVGMETAITLAEDPTQKDHG